MKSLTCSASNFPSHRCHMSPASQCAPRNRWIHWESIVPNLRCDTNEELHLGSTARGNDAVKRSAIPTNTLTIPTICGFWCIIISGISMYINVYNVYHHLPNFGSFLGGYSYNCSGKQSIHEASLLFSPFNSISIKKLCFTVVDSSVCDAQDGPSCQLWIYGFRQNRPPRFFFMVDSPSYHHHLPYFPMKIHHFWGGSMAYMGWWMSDLFQHIQMSSLWALTTSPVRPTGP
jgi:hypothetical protein